MKSSKELQSMLALEICNNISLIKEERELDCYNEIMGDSSFLLSGILEEGLEKYINWSSNKWIDDSLLHKMNFKDSKVYIWGVMIWGKEGTTKQWTEPFYSELLIDYSRHELQELIIMFGDEKVGEITYEEFSLNRTFWDKDFYSDTFWKPSERTWKYFVHTKI